MSTQTEQSTNTRSNSGDRPYRPARRSRHVEDDRGSVQTCYVCSLAYFSRYEPQKAKVPAHAADFECERCVTERIFLRNMQLLTEQAK